MLSRVRDLFDSGEIDVIILIAGKHNLAEALTKKNLPKYKLLNDTLASEPLPSAVFEKASRANYFSQSSKHCKKNSLNHSY